MGHRTATFGTSSPAHAASVWTIDAAILGWRPEGTRASHQVSMYGLDGGTFDVEVRLPGDTSWKSHLTGAGEADTVMVDTAIVDAFRITAGSMGGSAVPVVVVTSRQRGFAA